MYLELVVGHTDVRPAPRGSESKNEVEKGWKKVMSNSAQQSQTPPTMLQSQLEFTHSSPKYHLTDCSYQMLLGTRDSRVEI